MSANERHALEIVARLRGVGVEHFFVAPGSRSTPLVAAAARSGATMTSIVDERGGGFAAVGAARAGERAAVITTSGTAVANLLPALCEADADELALVALTADRPGAEVGVGANQTLDQPPLLAGPARAVVDLAAPPEFEGDYTALERALVALDGASPGPVHVNARFAKPLEPTGTEGEVEPTGAADERPPPPAPSPPWLAAERGLVVVGALPLADRAWVDPLLAALPWPAFVDVTSGLARDVPNRFAPALLRVAAARAALRPDRVLWLGGRLTEPAVAVWLATLDVPVTQWKSGAARRDPDGLLGDTRVVSFATLPDPSAARPSALVPLAARVAAALPALELELSEPFIARAVVDSCRAGEHVLVGNSMPVRDADRFARVVRARVLANRGVSGIDGNLATAFGAWRTTGRPTTALVGDLTLLHDASSLAVLAQHAAAVRIVVVNNRGGGIFHFLPIVEHGALFEPWFGTPHDVDLVAVARGFGLAARRVASIEELTLLLERPPRGPELIEVVTERVANRALHVELDRRAEASVAEALGTSS